METIKRFCLILMFLVLPLTLLADEFRIPFTCWPKSIQSEFAKYGRKVDLNGNERSKDSWGFIENKGTNYIICTYRTATKEDLEIIFKVVNKEYNE